jgi:indolepyruvate ferredoxin oxidoreductase, alpha subunit
MADLVLLGDEAVALGAIHAGISAAYGYPGTPSTEIIEYIEEWVDANSSSILASWCANEKTAYEDALGTSFVGKRVLVTMKHVGLNVAADAFVNSALLKIGGGLVVAVADDPGMHSSQNEQDSRYYADFAKIIVFEPRSQQEAYDMTREAFGVSERFHIPVMVRLATRLSHSRAVVVPADPEPSKPLAKAADPSKWMLLPAMARRNWKQLLESQRGFEQFAEESPRNIFRASGDCSKFGVITTGLGGNYYEENLAELDPAPPWLHVSVYPLPAEKIRALAAQVDRLVIIEEGYPFLESKLRGILGAGIEVDGKMNEALPPTGELTPDNVRPALGLPPKEGLSATALPLPGRPPQLCRGCPHRDTYDAINKAVEGFEQSLVSSDIGCYALGALPPYRAIETIVCMGASIGLAKGAAEGGLYPVVATIGDSTFLHSGMTGLLDAVDAETDMTVVIMDNFIVAMTGGQRTLLGSQNLERVVTGIGVDPAHVRVLRPLPKNTEENARIIREEIEYHGLSVIIARRECVAMAVKTKRTKVQAVEQSSD